MSTNDLSRGEREPSAIYEVTRSESRLRPAISPRAFEGRGKRRNSVDLPQAAAPAPARDEAGDTHPQDAFTLSPAQLQQIVSEAVRAALDTAPAALATHQLAPSVPQDSAPAAATVHANPAALPAVGQVPARLDSAAALFPVPASAASRPVASLRLPPFSTEETELWLSQVECALGVAGITDDLTRYQVLVVNLPTEVAVQVRDVISSPAPSYASLTAALRERLAQSRASRLEALLRHQQLGDQRPSELLRRMQGEPAMAGVLPADNGLLRTLYKQRLPQSARAAFSLLPENIPLPELAAAADRFMEANTPALSVSTVQQAPQPPNQSALDQLTASLLKERFARPAAIIFAHIEKLLKLGSKDEKELKMIQDELR
ncbi:hypothetical protein FJT64_025727 [Amphibalanus amphitrite]|uniref:DUF7041 domain-containing protein n=1 Tax=Amphibalanus amphitrite TaxID=1232801 RepID=A0A6A4W841_AMPAM|nr:hypothetical protein FJT64_025727 [Amphibalanus amphitrite]